MLTNDLRQELRVLKREAIALEKEIAESHRSLLAALGYGQGAPIEFKRAGGVSSEIQGYASAYNNIDSAKEIVVPGAFTSTLAKHRMSGTKPLMLWQHQTDEVIGVWDEFSDDQYGLLAKGRLLRSVRRGQEAADLIAEGALNGLSIGYKVLEDEIDAATGVRRLLKLQLFEVSLVSFPANRRAIVSSKEYTDTEIRAAMRQLSRAAHSLSEFGR